MTLSLRILFGLAVVLASARAGYGATIFLANLTTTQEPGVIIPTTVTGAPRPVPFGTATFVLNDAMTELSMTATVFDIDVTAAAGTPQTADPNDNLVAAHIHASSNPAFTPPATAGVVWGFFGTPDNDINPDNLVVTPFATGVGGTFTSIWNAPEGNGGTTLGLQLENLFAGRAYINFHTTQFGGGEIRGAITAVPEPSTMVLVGIGLGTLMKARRRKRGVRD